MFDEQGVFQREKHIKYWLRCAKTFLPSQYTSGDSNRMLLAFFIVAALDVLDVLDTKVSPGERKGWIDWIYSCQVPEGGFRGFTGTDLGELRNAENCHWDPANLPATFFALSTLLILGDGLSRLRREKCLLWLPKLQRENGSFGEVLGEDDRIEGGNDLRFCCCAAGIYRVLHGSNTEDTVVGMRRFDVQKMVEYISSCQTYEGGFSEGPFHEAHSGLTYCAIGALSLLNQIPKSRFRHGDEILGISVEECTRWMLHRQTLYIEEDESDDEESEPDLVYSSGQKDSESTPKSTKEDLQDLQLPFLQGISISDSNPAPEEAQAETRIAGFNGRPNKIADTCYSWWNTGALSMLGHHQLVDTSAHRRYLLEKVQHVVGGFGKGIGEPPDILHSYLGLATLALLEEPKLKTVDPTFCMSRDAVRNLECSALWREKSES